MDGAVPIILLALAAACLIFGVVACVLAYISVKREFSNSTTFYISSGNLAGIIISMAISIAVRNTAIGYAPAMVFGVLFIACAAITYRVAKRSKIEWYK